MGAHCITLHLLNSLRRSFSPATLIRFLCGRVIPRLNFIDLNALHLGTLLLLTSLRAQFLFLHHKECVLSKLLLVKVQ